MLAALDAPRPKGYGRWNGRLVAEHLGDVKAHHVWRVLRRRGISLERRRSWCVSTDPEFERKAADIVALYLAPPRNADRPGRGREASYPGLGAGAGLAALARMERP